MSQKLRSKKIPPLKTFADKMSHKPISTRVVPGPVEKISDRLIETKTSLRGILANPRFRKYQYRRPE